MNKDFPTLFLSKYKNIEDFKKKYDINTSRRLGKGTYTTVYFILEKGTGKEYAYKEFDVFES